MRIGVLGGGQLGRMLGLAGIPLGLEFRFFDPGKEAPAGAAGDVVRAQYDDVAALEEFAHGLDVITYEFENVPAASLDIVGAAAPIRPGRRALEVSQDRVTEKTFFASADVPTGQWTAVNSEDDLRNVFDQLGECIVKTRRFGYDGKGQARLRTADDCAPAWQQLGQSPIIVEKLVPFNRELSLIGVRSASGDFRTWPLVENVHRNGILHRTTAPAANVSAGTQTRAEQMLHNIMEKLDYIGVLTIELFNVDGELLANEMAPRVHNSGHWTIEGAVTSQFENHVRAIADLPLGSTSVRCPSIMLNCIGQMPPAADVLAIPGAQLHDYNKAARAGRKVGHITLLDEPAESAPLSEKATTIESLLDTRGSAAAHA